MKELAELFINILTISIPVFSGLLLCFYHFYIKGWSQKSILKKMGWLKRLNEIQTKKNVLLEEGQVDYPNKWSLKKAKFIIEILYIRYQLNPTFINPIPDDEGGILIEYRDEDKYDIVIDVCNEKEFCLLIKEKNNDKNFNEKTQSWEFNKEKQLINQIKKEIYDKN